MLVKRDTRLHAKDTYCNPNGMFPQVPGVASFVSPEQS